MSWNVVGSINAEPTPKDRRAEGAQRLVEAIYWQAIKDILNEWRYADKHGQERCSYDYKSAVAFLNSSEKGKRILRILNNLTEEQRANLINRGNLPIDTGVQWDTQNQYTKEERND